MRGEDHLDRQIQTFVPVVAELLGGRLALARHAAIASGVAVIMMGATYGPNWPDPFFLLAPFVTVMGLWHSRPGTTVSPDPLIRNARCLTAWTLVGFLPPCLIISAVERNPSLLFGLLALAFIAVTYHAISE